MSDKIFLHVGCGNVTRHKTTKGFASDGWREIRLDIDQAVKPDIIGSITAMPEILDASMDALFSAHNLEHLYAHEVPLALREFYRVLKFEGFLILTCPDIQAVAAAMAQGALSEALYHSPSGPISPLDIVFGHRGLIATGMTPMAHRTAFNQNLLAAELRRAGFATVMTTPRPEKFDMWALASPGELDIDSVRALAREHFPAGLTKGTLASAALDQVPPMAPAQLPRLRPPA
jgi:hypothetical protein